MRPFVLGPRRALAAALAGTALLLTGCGSDDGSRSLTAPDGSPEATSSRSASPAASPSPSPSPSDRYTGGAPGAEPSIPPAAPRLVDLVSVSAIGGEVTNEPTPVGSTQARRDYVAALAPRVRRPLQQAVLTVDAASGTEVTATVVAIGCDTPTDVEVTRTAEGYAVEAAPMRPSGVQCLVPVTTIAVVVLPAP